SGGRTTHCRFHIPINIDETSTFSMAKKHSVEALPKDVTEIREFASWILKVGDSELGEENDGEVEIDVLEEILIDQADDPVASIVYFTYPNILDNIHDPS
ncbi:ATP-dependent DNA helicase PIF1-like protein, partial [Tanacetum coccineum]